jgi:hypothetical protein
MRGGDGWDIYHIAHRRIVRKSGPGFPIHTMRFLKELSIGFSQKCLPLLGPILGGHGEAAVKSAQSQAVENGQLA